MKLSLRFALVLCLALIPFVRPSHGASTGSSGLYDSSGNFNWGNVKQFEVLTVGDGSSGGLNVSAPPGSTGYEITGNVGIAGTNSTLTISGNADILGNIYLNTGDKVSQSGPSTINGTIYSNSTARSLLNSAEASAIKISDLAEAANQTNYWSSSDLNLGSNKMVTLSTSGHFVMDLDDFIMGGGGNGKQGAILTLSGSSSTTFVFNIYGDFNIGGGAKILLTGGVTASDVIFNIVGCDSTVSIGGDALVNGTILALDSTVTISGHNTHVNGQIIAKQVCIKSGADVCISP